MKLSHLTVFLGLSSLLFSSSAIFAEETALDGRLNVMECSRSEVLAYLDKPDPEAAQVSKYADFDKAYREHQLLMAKTDPVTCATALYGDLNSLSDQLGESMMALKSMTMPSAGELMSNAMDSLSESVCKRLKAAETVAEDTIANNAEHMKLIAKNYVIENYGKKALEKYVDEAVIPKEQREKGLHYRNGTIETQSFTAHTKDKWKDKLTEMVKK
jgi:hypothetical protein